MDLLDLNVISALLKNGRATWTDLASQVGLTSPAVAERVKKLEEQKVIKGYAANVDYRAMGFAVPALVFVTLAQPQHRASFIQFVESCHEVIECMHITGDDDYMIKVICRDTQHLDELLSNGIKSIPGVLKTRTMVILSTQKERAIHIPEVK